LNQIMEMAKTLITIDHELAAVEIILK
jgi:hypothetical protein